MFYLGYRSRMLRQIRHRLLRLLLRVPCGPVGFDTCYYHCPFGLCLLGSTDSHFVLSISHGPYRAGIGFAPTFSHELKVTIIRYVSHQVRLRYLPTLDRCPNLLDDPTSNIILYRFPGNMFPCSSNTRVRSIACSMYFTSFSVFQ